MIFELYVNANKSRRQISRELNESGFTVYGRLFCHPVITQVLANPAYAGEDY